MRRLTAQPWFRRRRIGFGWRPVSWEGWATTAVTVGLAVVVLVVLHGSPARIPIVILVLAVHAIVAMATGGTRRGGDDRTEGPTQGPTGGPTADVTSVRSTGPRAARRRPSPVPSGAPALSVEHLTKRFGERVAVEDVSFEVAAGEVFGFLGPNGAGKTTTVRMLATLITPTSGSALVTGLPSNRPTASRSAAGSR